MGLTTYVYKNGSWQEVDWKVYNNGQWKNVMLDLFHNDDWINGGVDTPGGIVYLNEMPYETVKDVEYLLAYLDDVNKKYVYVHYKYSFENNTSTVINRYEYVINDFTSSAGNIEEYTNDNYIYTFIKYYDNNNNNHLSIICFDKNNFTLKNDYTFNDDNYENILYDDVDNDWFLIVTHDPNNNKYNYYKIDNDNYYLLLSLDFDDHIGIRKVNDQFFIGHHLYGGNTIYIIDIVNNTTYSYSLSESYDYFVIYCYYDNINNKIIIHTIPTSAVKKYYKIEFNTNTQIFDNVQSLDLSYTGDDLSMSYVTYFSTIYDHNNSSLYIIYDACKKLYVINTSTMNLDSTYNIYINKTNVTLLEAYFYNTNIMAIKYTYEDNGTETNGILLYDIINENILKDKTAPDVIVYDTYEKHSIFYKTMFVHLWDQQNETISELYSLDNNDFTFICNPVYCVDFSRIDNKYYWFDPYGNKIILIYDAVSDNYFTQYFSNYDNIKLYCNSSKMYMYTRKDKNLAVYRKNTIDMNQFQLIFDETSTTDVPSISREYDGRYLINDITFISYSYEYKFTKFLKDTVFIYNYDTGDSNFYWDYIKPNTHSVDTILNLFFYNPSTENIDMKFLHLNMSGYKLYDNIISFSTDINSINYYFIKFNK